MKNDEFNRIDQAVFGYSNGHRELASSLTLSSIDSYELAAASDLAPGAQLGPDDSYLTGLTLPDSKRYALIRTWLAPEMPRPGCVWSHVLILDKQVLSTQADLTVLNRMFRRPDRYLSDASLSISNSVSLRAKGQTAHPSVVEQVLVGCYLNKPLSESFGSPDELERAILTVWSQQWPRLRGTFAFRSILSTSDFKGQSIHFRQDGHSIIEVEAKRWVAEAVKDATSGTVTPLRRFLWRYGKDVDTSRRTFPYLVNIFLETRGRYLNPNVALSVYEQFKSGQGETLKRDMLGFSHSKLSLVPALSKPELLELVYCQRPETLDPSKDELVAIFASSSEDELLEIVQTLDLLKGRIGPLDPGFEDVLVPLATAEHLRSTEMPGWFLEKTLMRRPELISADICARLPSSTLVQLAEKVITRDKLEFILRTIIEREFVNEFQPLVDMGAGFIFLQSLEAYEHSALPRSWIDVFNHTSDRFIQYVEDISVGDDLAIAADLLGYPTSDKADVGLWHWQLRNLWSTASRTSQTTMLTYGLVLCVRTGLENNGEILRDLVPELRNRILAGDLPATAKRMLEKILPEHAESWDLNRRLLKLFRRVYKQGKELDGVLDAIDLTDDEYAYATNQDPENLIRSVFRLFMPWVP